ncbi:MULTISPECIES: amylo-alpha-1,6-glucosidase [Pseudomonadaceae]|jgi:glycogen debranching enzyme|uniref:Amylo-alpha-1,6-glucosidase n=1 Tax=Stutzerimonas stutzeri TaxID=316 RepID=A0A0D9AFG8_STUST|nr:amylo-alpha-1,6-glucosidase [Stutzerimonas stutzeri]KJH79457.1 amylo-alpha-1,6-glucosidase [Stutzerimonas stutzeri]
MNTTHDTHQAYMPRTLYVLKDGDSFMVADAFGDVQGTDDGLFRNDTRVLSRLQLRLAGQPASLLSAAVSQDNVYFTAHLSNRPLRPLGDTSTPQGVIHVERKRFLWQGRLYERLSLANYSDQPTLIPLSLGFAADFRDMFEVRGQTRAQRGEHHASELGERHVAMRYAGLDNQLRCSAISFSLTPTHLSDAQADFQVDLDAGERWALYLEIGIEPAAPGPARFRQAAANARRSMRRQQQRGARLYASGRLFQSWLDKSRADVALLTTDLPTGPYPYAGIPWFSTPFGRDAIFTALQTLWLDPALARGVLAYLAAHQASETSRFRDAEPGKIMHETRKGEMSAVNELPFGRYYGGVDTTPLFVVLAGAYARRSGDRQFIDSIWPALRSAIGWVEQNAANHPEGFLAYARGEASGLLNQGWKDSHDSVFHADGRTPDGPIALVEVQGYAFRAYLTMAELAGWHGDADSAAHWRQQAERLRTAVERQFWLDDQQFYALAIDGAGEPCRIRTSNAGHLLYCGLPEAVRGRALAQQLLASAFNSGWGIRTLAPEAARFNPMSYHNGSIWPHDVALCAAGLAQYGERDGVVRLLSGLFEAATHFGMRLPELFCGFSRSPGEAPTAYPVACLPQAWAAGSVFMLLQACLGLEVDGRRQRIQIRQPRLPAGIDRLQLRRLAVGEQLIDLTFQRLDRRVVAFVEAQHGPQPVSVDICL